MKKTNFKTKTIDAIEKFFKIKERNTRIKVEILSGVVSFLAMCYILFVNPSILAESSMPYGGAFLATAISAFIGSILMGLFANLPIGLAPGMGINAFFTYTLVKSLEFRWQEALGVSLFAGLVFLLISLTPLRKIIIKAIPKDLKLAIGAGIGFFVAFIGLKEAKIIVSDPNTLVALGDFTNPAVILAIVGILLSLILFARNVKFNFIISIISIAVLGTVINYIYYGVTEKFIEGLPKFREFNYSKLGEFADVFGQGVSAMFTKSFWKLSLIASIVTLVFVDMFDSIGTFMGLTDSLEKDENGEIIGARKGLVMDSISTVSGAVLGTSAVTVYIESTAGIKFGGKTGLSAIVVGLLFGLSIALFPIFSVFSAPAVTTMVLFTVGIMMTTQLKYLDYKNPTILAASFTTIIMMLLTFSISNGIAMSFIVYSLMEIVRGRYKKVHPMMYILSVVFVIYFIVMPLL
ncbi:NCS2 family permease [Mycoplasma phocoenae]|uniref:NCS2 family permease n=1 Tax=Mycoplasma phocoenae TaxID=754517 RepID=A0A858U6F7_9MOLU|nr:NCS2 family permease [Mycoplasma phocoenae]QJG66813.1 NCS2 family permease [Mycoplasma phocoenae]